MKILKNFLSGILIAGFALAPVPARGDALSEDRRAADNKDFYAQMTLLATVMELLRANYVDGGKIGYGKLAEGALKGMLRELDPYSTYENPAEFRASSARLAGGSVGVGVIVVKRANEPMRVVGVHPGSPAEKAGIKPGEYIVEIDGRKTFPLGLDACTGLIRGAAGKPVRLLVRGAGGAAAPERELEVNRAMIRMAAPAAAGARMTDDKDKIGYIRLGVFSLRTSGELDAALAKLRKEGMRALILDLRFNPGGLMKSAFDVCERFLPADELIVSVEERDGRNKQEFRTGKQAGHDEKLPLAVLVNGYSASSSEIVAGCLSDHKRARIVGERTFGKGSVQRLQQLPNGGAVRFTVAHYYTPERRLIHGHGLEPDTVVGMPRKDEFALGLQLMRRPGEVLPPGKHAVRDIQLEKAIQLLRKELN